RHRGERERDAAQALAPGRAPERARGGERPVQREERREEPAVVLRRQGGAEERAAEERAAAARSRRRRAQAARPGERGRGPERRDREVERRRVRVVEVPRHRPEERRREERASPP